MKKNKKLTQKEINDWHYEFIKYLSNEVNILKAKVRKLEAKK